MPTSLHLAPAARWASRAAVLAALVALPLAASADPAQLKALNAKVEALSAQVAALESRAQPRAAGLLPADVVGTWNLAGFQSELNAGAGNWKVQSYVFSGTVVFTSDGKYKMKSVTAGNELKDGGSTVSAFTKPEESGKGKWSVKNNQLLLDGDPVAINAQKSVVTAAFANPDDNTNVMLVLTKQP